MLGFTSSMFGVGAVWLEGLFFYGPTLSFCNCTKAWGLAEPHAHALSANWRDIWAEGLYQQMILIESPKLDLWYKAEALIRVQGEDFIEGWARASGFVTKRGTKFQNISVPFCRQWKIIRPQDSGFIQTWTAIKRQTKSTLIGARAISHVLASTEVNQNRPRLIKLPHSHLKASAWITHLLPFFVNNTMKKPIRVMTNNNLPREARTPTFRKRSSKLGPSTHQKTKPLNMVSRGSGYMINTVAVTAEVSSAGIYAGSDLLPPDIHSLFTPSRFSRQMEPAISACSCNEVHRGRSEFGFDALLTVHIQRIYGRVLKVGMFEKMLEKRRC